MKKPISFSNFNKEAYEPITTKNAMAFAKADSEPRKKVTLPKAPWDKGTKANVKGTNVTYDKNGNVVKEGGFSRIDHQQKSGEKGTGLDTFKKKPTETDLEKTRRMAKQNMKPVGSKPSKKPDDEMREDGAPKIKLPMRDVSVKGVAKDAEKYASKDKRAADGGPTDAQKAGAAKFHAANKLQPGRPKSAAQKVKITGQPMEAFSSRAIVKKDRQGDGKPMSGYDAVAKKYGVKPRQMKDPKKDAMVSKDGKVKVIDKNKEDDHLKKGYVRAEHMISKELYMKEAKTMMVTHPKTPNRSMEISVDQWPSFKMRGYHHAEQKENTNSMRLINKMKKASPAAKKALEAPSRVDNNKGNGLSIADVRKATEKAKKRQDAEAKARTAVGHPPKTIKLEAKKPSADHLAKIGVTPVSQMTPAQKKADAERRKEYIAFQKSKRNEAVQEAEECECTICECNPCTCGPTSGMPTADAEGLGEALDMKQRLARGRSARKNKSKMAMGRRRAGRRIASMKVLKKRARRAARKTLTKRLTKGIAKSDLSVSRKREIEKRLDKPAFKIKANRLVKRTIKDIRKKEIARKRK